MTYPASFKSGPGCAVRLVRRLNTRFTPQSRPTPVHLPSSLLLHLQVCRLDQHPCPECQLTARPKSVPQTHELPRGPYFLCFRSLCQRPRCLVLHFPRRTWLVPVPTPPSSRTGLEERSKVVRSEGISPLRNLRLAATWGLISVLPAH